MVCVHKYVDVVETIKRQATLSFDVTDDHVQYRRPRLVCQSKKEEERQTEGQTEM